MPAKGQTKKQKKAKGAKKKIQKDAFLKKEWYVVKIPKNQFPDCRNYHRIAYTPVNKSKMRKALDRRSFVFNWGDLQKDPYESKDLFNKSYKKFKFITEEVQPQQLLTQFHGMEITRDKRCSLIRKWHTMIETLVVAKTLDKFVLRVKALAFTKRQPTQVKKNCYAKNSQVRTIRALMTEKIKNTISESTLQGVIKRLSAGEIGRDIERSCQLIYPLRDCMIEKVKVLSKPKRDVARLMEIHDLSVPAYDQTWEELEAELADAAEAEGNDDGDGDGDGDDDDDDDDDDVEV